MARSTNHGFALGHIPWNKGIKGIHLSPLTEFKKGRPTNRAPLGTVRFYKYKGNKNLRAHVKVKEPNVWKLKSVALWEQQFGKVPKGFIIHHKDNNELNDVLDNFELLSRAEHLNKHRPEIQEIKKNGIIYKEKPSKCSICQNEYICKRRDSSRRQICQQCKPIARRETLARYRARKKLS